MSNLIYWPIVVGPVSADNPSHDPYFSSVVMLCHWDGTNGQQSFTNSCPRGTTIANTTGGGSSISTTSPQFGTGSLACSAYPIPTSGTHADYALGSGDWTIELSLKTATPSQGSNILDMRTTSNQVSPVLYIASSSFHFFVSNADKIAGGSVATSTWQQIAVSKVSGTTRMFVGGTQVGSNYTDGNTYVQVPIFFGGVFNGAAGQLNPGNIDEVRITKGVGRYTTTYTPATAAFPNQ